MIVATIGATLLFTRDGGSDASGPPASAVASDIASANDTGPVSVITDEPTCEAFNAINNSLADIQAKGWGGQRADLGPASSWTAEQRTKVDTVGTAMRNAADQVVALAKQTPHRVVREIYEQFIAYGRAYADSIATYTPADNGLASANVNASSAIIGICNSIEYGASGRSLALSPAAPPTGTSRIGDPADPVPFVPSSSAVCTEWVDRSDEFNSKTPDWQARDVSVAASSWTPERRAIEEAVTPLLATFAEQIESVGRNSNNPTFENLATTAAVYIRAYLSTGNTYVDADGWLVYTGFRVVNLVSGACRAVTG